MVSLDCVTSLLKVCQELSVYSEQKLQPSLDPPSWPSLFHSLSLPTVSLHCQHTDTQGTQKSSRLHHCLWDWAFSPFSWTTLAWRETWLPPPFLQVLVQEASHQRRPLIITIIETAIHSLVLSPYSSLSIPLAHLVFYMVLLTTWLIVCTLLLLSSSSLLLVWFL